MEGIPVLEPLEHSVLVGALDSGLMEGMSHLEPLEHSVLNVARGGKEASVFEPLEHSVLMMTLDDSPLEKMSDDEPLEPSVLDAAMNSRPIAGALVVPPLQCSFMVMGLERGLLTEDSGPPFGPDHDLTLSDGPHATGIVDRISDGSVPLPAVIGTPMDAFRWDFSVGTWMVMFNISMRHLMVCQCIMAVICMIRIGTTHTPLLALCT